MAHMYEEEARLESELPQAITAARVLTPNLVVLLGSTSALAGLELMRHMLTLRSADQQRVALVYIDTDDPPAPLVEFRRQHNNVFLEFPLRIAVPIGISNATRIDESDQHTFIQQRVPQYFANGAGGIRNNGHVAASFNYQYIYDVLDRALMALGRLGRDQNISKTVGVQANIVAFLGGGTGSGILTDIAVMVRDLLTYRQYKQRLNLFCMLPEPINGENTNDLRWRKSNATACLLETLAYSRAAAGDPCGEYKKYMRNRMHRLTNDPIANEVYLVGHASMDDSMDTARLVGLDLFQRTTNAAGVGFLEHSRWADRRTLGAADDRGLPTMFGTSCPLEVRFPATETASAFAQVAASYLLPLLASYQPESPRASEDDRRAWSKEWSNVARIEANESNPLSVKLGAFRGSDFEDASQTHLDLLWSKLERMERGTEARMQEIFEAKRREEQGLIEGMPEQALSAGGTTSLLNQRVQYLKSLQQEYQFMLERLRDIDVPRVPMRPYELEEKLVHQPALPGPLRKITRDYASAVADAYNERLRRHALATRYRFLEQLLKDLNTRVQTALSQSLSWFQSTGAEEHARELRSKGQASMAWHGKLEYPHPHQRHIFDLPTLRTEAEHNVALERLYLWATSGDSALEEGHIDDYQSFIKPCAEFLARVTNVPGGSSLSIERSIAARLSERVIDFFRDYYIKRFADINLFELLNKAAPPSYSDGSRDEQISSYFLEHLEYLYGLMSSLVAFEAELWPEGLSTLDTSLYMGIAWRGGGQEALFKQVVKSLSAHRGLTPLVNAMYDPHRLQVCYGQHAISLSTVRDFYLEHNSAMEYYQEFQKAWRESSGTGLMPVHSSGEAERLVMDKDALGYGVPLADLVIRRLALPGVQEKRE
ncbi:tubulin-like doman-containing protein [Reticulibacter mediterranei]|nr:tubulin-like doman-containing protein [Reticulibacter mediterranei]